MRNLITGPLPARLLGAFASGFLVIPETTNQNHNGITETPRSAVGRVTFRF